MTYYSLIPLALDCIAGAGGWALYCRGRIPCLHWHSPAVFLGCLCVALSATQ